MKRFVLLWVVSLVLVATVTFTFAQGRTLFPQPQILSGNDIGFRAEGTDLNGKLMGTLMVRVNGTWVEVGGGASVRPAK